MKKLLVLVLALGMICTISFAQTKGASIYGTAVLADGSKIPGVAVVLTGEKTGKKTTVTSEKGNYRFLDLHPGTYQVQFELEGFKTVVHKRIVVALGETATIHATMETTTVQQETVEVVGKISDIDLRKTTVKTSIDSKMIESLPSARNPWTVLDLIPGMMVDRADVGGAESGQQSSFIGNGASRDDTTWNVDGANITDPSAIGAAPGYLNMNAYEEFQVTLGQNDITAQTGGTQLNFVTKRAGNKFSGDFHLYVEDEMYQLEHKNLPESYTDKGWGDARVSRLYQYGVNFGGPVVKDKLWFIGSWAIQDIHSLTYQQNEDDTWLHSAYGKLDFQTGNTSGGVHYAYDAKKKWGRTSSWADGQDANTTWDQVGPGSVFSGHLQQITGNLMLNAKFAYTDGGFTMDPKANGLNDNYITNHTAGPEMIREYQPMRYFRGSKEYYTTNRNTLNLGADGNYFLEETLGGDHEIKFGVDYYTATTTSQSLYPNQRQLVYYDDPADPNGEKEIWFVQDYMVDLGFKRISAYVQDTVTFGKLTVNLGVRYDRETGSHGQATSPGLNFDGTPIFTGHFQDVSSEPMDADASFNVISPRISLTYDLTGDGKNVVKAGWGRYGSQSGNNIANHTWALDWREVDVAWNDDGDGILERNEFDDTFGTWSYWSIDENAPYATVSSNKYDPDFNSQILTEYTLSYERAFSEDLVIGLNAFYKVTNNIAWYRGLFTSATGDGMYQAGDIETFDNYYVGGNFEFADGQTKDYYLRHNRPQASYLTNHSNGWKNVYKAIQLTFRKKLSNKWMLNASFDLMDWKAKRIREEYFCDSPDGTTIYPDPSNFDYFSDGVVAPGSWGSGLSGIYTNATWMVKFAGLYQLPWGLNLTAVFNARDGYIIPYQQTFNRAAALGETTIYEPGKKFGDDRLPTFYQLNMGLEKVFRVSDNTTATIFVDAYNLTNNDVIMKKNFTIGDDRDEPLRFLNPCVFQFGIRVNF